MWRCSRGCWHRGRKTQWAVGGRRAQGGPVTAQPCAGSRGSSCAASVWSPPTTCKPASCGRKRGVRRKTRAAPPTEEELAEEKAQAELSVAPDLLGMVPLRGRLVTGDALSCQHTRCQQIPQAHGHSLFVIQLNQPEVFAEVAPFSYHPPPAERFATAGT